MSTDTVTPLRQRLIEDMNARSLGYDSAGGIANRFTRVLGRSVTSSLLSFDARPIAATVVPTLPTPNPAAKSP